MPPSKRRGRVLTNLKIAEISAVDHGAGEGVRIMMMKSASNAAITNATKHLALSVKSILDDPNCDKNDMLTKTFSQFQEHLRKVVIKNSAERAEPDLSDSDAGMPDRRRRRRREDEAARLAAEMDTDADRDDESDEGGNDGESKDQLERAERAMKGDNMQTHSELMSAVVKQYGITAFCKSVANGDVRVSEHRLTELISEHCARTGVSFSKLFEANTDEGVTLRKAIAAARDAQFLSRTATLSKQAEGMPGRATLTPRVTGGRAARAVDNPKSALDELQSLVDAQRAQNPALSESAAWLSVYTDPKNADLAARERAENRPTASWG
jgi:hypothetical protein